jgi:hypothetical protein
MKQEAQWQICSAIFNKYMYLLDQVHVFIMYLLDQVHVFIEVCKCIYIKKRAVAKTLDSDAAGA